MNALIVIDNKASTASVSGEADSMKLMALERCALIGVVKNQDQQAAAVGALREIKSVLKSIEVSRVAQKEPVLELCRKIDAAAKAFKVELDAEDQRINKLLADYQSEQLEIARALERERQAELDRIEAARQAELQRIENERKEAEKARQAELDRIAKEEAAAKAKIEAENARIEALRRAEAQKLADAKSARERARLQAEQARLEALRKIESDRIAKEQAEANAVRRAEQANIDAQRQAEEQARQAELQRQEELNQQRIEAAGILPVTSAKAKGQTVKEEFDYEVTDIWLLARCHPALVNIEPNRSQIRELINKGGVTAVKGLRVFPVIKNHIRADKTIVIDV